MTHKKILIAGGAGFIGSHLCKKQLEQGHSVICIDNLSSGQYQNIEPLLASNNFKFIETDITENLDQKLFINTDEIYNLACPASPIHYQKTPIETTMSSVLGSYNLLILARHLNAKYLLASTSEIYGDPTVHPQTESYNGNTDCESLRACYVESKRTAETLAYDFKRKFNVNTKVVRIFNTYGPNMRIDDGRVVSNFIVNTIHDKSLQIHGDGKQTRSFCYIDDLIKGLDAIMSSSQAGPINLGNPSEISINELAQTVLTSMSSKAKMEHSPAVPGEPKIRRPDISLALNSLKWSPETPLDQGLQKTIEYFKKIL